MKSEYEVRRPKTEDRDPENRSMSSVFPEREAVEGNRIEGNIRLGFCQTLVNRKFLTFNIEY